MAIFKCLHHRPDHPHYRTYARPLAHLEEPCDEEGCTQHVIVWLNPEEVRDYERGSRLFCDATFQPLKVTGEGLSSPRPAPLRPRRLNLRPLYEAFQPFGHRRKKAGV